MTTHDKLDTMGNAMTTAFVNFTLRKTVIEHHVFAEAIHQIATIHSRGVHAGVSDGLLIYGQTGSGKSTLLRYYGARFPATKSEGRTRIPIVIVTTPESPTVKTLAEAILNALGDPAASMGTANTKTERIRLLFERCKVELLMIDEFQHFCERLREKGQIRVTDWLKNLFNVTRVPVVLAGLPRSMTALQSNPQLRRRFSAPLYLKPFGFDVPDDQRAFRALLQGIHAALPIACAPLHESNMARRFYIASNGLIDYVVKIIDTAVSSVLTRDTPELILSSFEAAFRMSVWREAPKELNPFSEKSVLRPLTKRGEPFDIWDDPAKYWASSSVTGSD
jgi:energy-coupling factor transporter ATP-binding protein EcfA2